MINKLYTSWVHFEALGDCPNVTSPLVKGESYSVWVTSKTKDATAIRDAADYKIMRYYGIKIKITSYSVEWYH